MECPICLRTFSLKRIEAHAANCDGKVEPSSTCAFSKLMGASRSSTAVAKQATLAEAREVAVDIISKEQDTTTVVVLLDENSMSPASVDSISAPLPTAKRSITDVLMSSRKKVVAAESDADTTIDSASTPRDHAEKRMKSDRMDIDAEEDRTTFDGCTKSGPSAIMIMMSAAAELSRPECFVFDYESRTCRWIDNVALISVSDEDWKQYTNLGRGMAQTKVLLVGKNLPKSSATALVCEPMSRLSIGMLKSIMQKAFRRRDRDTCRKAACELALKSWRDLVRRVPIVILEDGIINSEYAGLVWIMLAESAGLPVSRLLVLFVVNELAWHAERTLLDSNGWTAGFDGTKDGDITRGDLIAMNNEENAAITFALKARAVFGGMGGDVMMCKAYARVWHNRLTGRDGDEAMKTFSMLFRQSSTGNEEGNTVLEGFDRRSDLASLAPGVDFHCQPRIFDPIVKSRQVAMDDFRSAMWRFRSGLNYRATVSTNAHGQAVLPLPCPSALDLEENRTRCLRKQRGEALGEDDEGSSELFQVWRKVADDCEKVSHEFLRSSLN